MSLQSYITNNDLAWSNVGTQVELVDSTNTSLQEVVRKNYLCGIGTPEGTSIRADFQVAGRGRMRRVWESKAGENLLVSYALDASYIPLSQIFALSQSVSLAVANTIETFLPKAEVLIKWPNDVFVGEQKIAGILIENVLRQEHLAACIVGIGINVNQSFFAEADHGVSIQVAGRRPVSVKAVWLELTQQMEVNHRALRAQFSAKFLTQLSQNYIDRLFAYQKLSRFKSLTTGHTFLGTLQGVSNAGKAQIFANGRVDNYDMNEVRFLHSV